MRRGIAGPGRLWLFDIDGTLVAPSEDQLSAWVAAFRQVFGLEPAPAAIGAHLGRTFAEIVQEIAAAEGRRVCASHVAEALSAYTRHVCGALAERPGRLLAGTRELLDFLRGRGALVGVVTGNFPEEGELKLAGVGLREMLDLVVYADLETPARDVLLRRALGLARARGFPGDFGQTVVVGDSVHDIRSARRTGALAVAVCTGVTPAERLAAAGPDLLVADLPGLLATLRRGSA
jgi:phosphoglycolate phosphatase-like HAD superfamily hydrolase